MMTLDRARQAVAMAMFDLERRIKREGAIRNTTGKIFDEMTTTVDVGADYIEAALYANDYWRLVGNGRGPGGMPPVQRIQEWVDRAGVTVSAWAIAKSIAQRGTKAFREGKPNVFLSAADVWAQDALGEVEQAAQMDMENAAVEVVVTNLRA